MAGSHFTCSGNSTSISFPTTATTHPQTGKACISHFHSSDERDTVTKTQALVSPIKVEKFSLNFSSVNLKMALTSGGGHGGKRINSGRKRVFEKYRTEKDI